MPADEPLALYVHWPFCVSKCPYCDFNSHVRQSVDHDRWRQALLADLAHEAALMPGRTLGSIFFGGGTPSLMDPATAAAIIDAAARHWNVASDIEITLEANPSSVEAERFGDLALAGVNRVSLGLQSLDDSALQFLGRAHDVNEGLSALAVAQSAFDRVSFDLIYALPWHDAESWQAELDRAIGFGTGHLSLYQLTIEPGTRFARLAEIGDLVPLDAEIAADLFELTRSQTAAAGLPAYEISNHARPGEESRHNLTYWRYGDYVGIGPGAHGRRGGMATVRHKKPENWLSAIDRASNGIISEDRLDPRERAVEALLMGLRLSGGIDMDRLIERTGVAQPTNEGAVERLRSLGLVERDRSSLTVTERGMLVLDSVLMEIVA